MSGGRRGQAGYTLVELIIASGLAAFVLSALTSVIFVATEANHTWSPQLQATGEIRQFQHAFYDDAALSDTPATNLTTNPCLNPPSPAPTPPIELNGLVYAQPSPRSVDAFYCWDPVSQTVKRFVGSSSTLVARNVTAFTWTVNPGDGEVIVTITTTDNNSPHFFSTTEKLHFYPRRNAP